MAVKKRRGNEREMQLVSEVAGSDHLEERVETDEPYFEFSLKRVSGDVGAAQGNKAR